MKRKGSYSEYTEYQFIELIRELQSAETESERNLILDHLAGIIPHPAGPDLLYYPEPGADDSPEGVTQIIKEWCEANGLPGFKSQF